MSVIKSFILIFLFSAKSHCQNEDYEVYYYDTDIYYDEPTLAILCENYPEKGYYPSPKGSRFYLHCEEDVKACYEARCPDETPVFVDGFCDVLPTTPAPTTKKPKTTKSTTTKSTTEASSTTELITEEFYTDTEEEDTPPTAKIDESSTTRKTTKTTKQTVKTTKTTKTTKPTTKTTKTTKATKPTTKTTKTTKTTQTTLETSQTTTPAPIPTLSNGYNCPEIDDPFNIIFIPSKNSCSQYFICYHGRPTAMFCENGFHFNPDTKKCDYPGNVNCSAIDGDGSNWKPKCQSRSDIEYYNHPHICSFFYVCQQGNLSLQQCPGTYSWDLKSKRCIRQHLDDCRDFQ